MASDFVDESQVHVKGGNGGAGAVLVPQGGARLPRRVLTEATAAKAAVSTSRPRRISPRFSPSSTIRTVVRATEVTEAARNGTVATGADLVVPVPVGTIARHHNGDVLADLTSDGDRYLAAAGGKGGRGKRPFSEQSVARARLRGASGARRGSSG